MNVDRDIVLRGQIGEQQIKWIIRRRRLVGREAVKMLGGHFANPSRLAQKFFRDALEFFLTFRFASPVATDLLAWPSANRRRPSSQVFPVGFDRRG